MCLSSVYALISGLFPNFYERPYSCNLLRYTCVHANWSSDHCKVVTCMQVMCGVVSKLAALHAAGYAHRHVTLGSLVRARDEAMGDGSGRWMLRDLNTVAEIGVPLNHLPWLPPHQAQFYVRNRKVVSRTTTTRWHMPLCHCSWIPSV